MKQLAFIIVVLFSLTTFSQDENTQEVKILPGSSAVIETEGQTIIVKCLGETSGNEEAIVCDCFFGFGPAMGQVTGTANSNFNQMCDKDVWPMSEAKNCRKL